MIYVMNVDGSGQTRLTINEFENYNPAWSPDGTKIAFDSILDADCTEISVCSSSEIWVMNSDGSGQIQLTNSEDTVAGSTVWSPDGTKIAFASGTLGDSVLFDIWVMNADGSDQTRLTNYATWENPISTRWEPDWTLE